MKLSTILLLSVACLYAVTPERRMALETAKNHAKRLAQFQRLSARAIAAQKEVEAFIAEWSASCPSGVPAMDGGCQPKPAPTTAHTPPLPHPPAKEEAKSDTN